MFINQANNSAATRNDSLLPVTKKGPLFSESNPMVTSDDGAMYHAPHPSGTHSYVYRYLMILKPFKKLQSIQSDEQYIKQNPVNEQHTVTINQYESATITTNSQTRNREEDDFDYSEDDEDFDYFLDEEFDDYDNDYDSESASSSEEEYEIKFVRSSEQSPTVYNNLLVDSLCKAILKCENKENYSMNEIHNPTPLLLTV